MAKQTLDYTTQALHLPHQYMRRARLLISCFLLSMLWAGYLVENCAAFLESIERHVSVDLPSDLGAEDNSEEGKEKGIEEFLIHQSTENNVSGFLNYRSRLPEYSEGSCNYSNGFGDRIDSPPDLI